MMLIVALPPKKKGEASSKRKGFAMIGWVVGPELLLFLFNVRDVVGLTKRNKKQETGNRKQKEKRSHRSVSLVCRAEGSPRREIEREEHPDLPTDTVPPDSPATYITYLGGSTGKLYILHLLRTYGVLHVIIYSI